MKAFSLTKHLPLVALGAGVLGALMRFLLYAIGEDEKGLLVAGHPVSILLMILTVAVTAALVLGCLPLKDGNKFSFNFPASLFGAVGCFCGAAGVLADAVSHIGGGLLESVTFVAGLLSTAALGFVGWCRMKGKQPSVLFHGVVCLYLVLELVSIYQKQSATPQLQDYAFSLLGSVCVMLACYHDAAFAVRCGDRRKHTFFHLAAVYLCLVSLPNNSSFAFYLTLAVWMFTGICNLSPMRRRRERKPEA